MTQLTAKQQLNDIMHQMNGNYSRLEAKLRAKYPELLRIIVDSWGFSFKPKNFLEVCYHFTTSESPICPRDNRKKFEYYSTGYVGCSKSCECVKEQRASTMVARYGVAHALQSNELLSKAEASRHSKYGTTVLSEINSDQKKKTNNERYGAATPLESKAVRKKIKETNIARRGVDAPFKDKDVQNKAVETIRARYGVDNVLTLPKNKQAAKDATLKKYGVESIFSLEAIRNKVKKTISDRYGVEHISQRHIDPCKLTEFKDDLAFTRIYTEFDRVVDVMEYFGVKQTSIHRRAAELGLPTKFNHVSNDEQKISDFLSQFTAVEQSNRSVIAPKEIDIWLPEYKLGIEYNGIYHHSSKFGVDQNAHLSKTKMVEAQGAELIHIFSDEWLLKQDIVKSRLLNKIGKTPTIVYARKCKITVPEKTKVREFVESSHIQGHCSFSIQYSLEFNDQIVAVMTFGKPRFTNKADWELIRFCTAPYMSVVGGASKLLSYFRKNHAGSIISYADRRWSSGNLYRKLGFTFSHYSGPNYFYVIRNQRETRNKYQKHKLAKMLLKYNSELSETKNMENNGFYKIYDCGNSVWYLQ